MTTKTPDEDDLESQARRIHAHLESTAELPIDPKANRWLGEAEAVARDAATGGLEDETIRKRLRQVRHLLEEADEVAHPEATDHIESAYALCVATLENESTKTDD